MEQIIITRKDGTTYPLAVKKEATDIKEARQSWGLLGDDVVNITVESPYPQHYEIGDYFSVFGRTYKINQPARVRKRGMHKYTYELTFEGVQYDLLRAFYDVTIETTGNTLQDIQGDALYGNLHRFATVLVSNANRVFPNKWKLGTCPDTITDKNLTFGQGDNCLGVLQNLCRTFEVEAEITQQDGICTIHFYKRVGSTHPFVFEFGKGKGLYALDRQNVDNSNIITRLKAFGSTENIANGYRANRLCLPGKSKAQSFIEQEEAVRKYGIHEACKIFEDIKPTFNGKVTKIFDNNVLQFQDENMFDLNATEADGKTTKYLIAGVNAKIHFNTGNLAGHEFEINASKGGYNHNTHTFTLIPSQEAGGYTFPSKEHKAFRIAIGDEYKILDITLPERYQQEAERKLHEQASEYYRQNCQPKVKYGLSLSKAYLKKLFGEEAQVTLFSPGDYINIKDDAIGVEKAVRIQSLQRNLLDIYDYTLTLSDVVENNITTRVISELVEIDKITTTHRLKDPTRARANWRSSREILNMVFDPDGDYYTDKIKPNSIDTLALSVGAKAMQFSLQDVVFEPNYQGQKNIVRVSAGTLTHYTIEEQPRVWAITKAIVELNEEASAYYIFAKCSKADNSAAIIFSKEPVKTEDVAGFYHFWIGVVNSVDTTFQARSIALSYGFSMINGRFIKTGRVESADGSTYFDLDQNEIGGRIKFKDGIVSGDVSVGNGKNINAGISGEGNNDKDVRFYAGTSKNKKEQAPFRVMQDGSVVMEKATVKGEAHINNGSVKNIELRDVRIHGSFTNAFQNGYYVIDDKGGAYVGTLGLQNNNHVVIPGTGGSWGTAFQIPFDLKYSGFRAIILNDRFGTEYPSGAIVSNTAPSGKFFYENGKKYECLVIEEHEGVEMIGYGDKETFWGWIILRRFYTDAKYMKGLPLYVAYMGMVNKNGEQIKVESYDATPITTQRLQEGRYQITFNPGYSSNNDYMVFLTGDAAPESSGRYASVYNKTQNGFCVYTGDDASPNDAGFTFMIVHTHNFTRWRE